VGFKFVHAADLHLDSPFRGVATDGRLWELFRRSTLKAFSRIVDLCLRERAQFLVIAGDLFDLKDRSVRARLALRKELARLDAAGIATFIVHGNHDPLSADSGSVGLPTSVKVFGACWEEAQVSRDGEILCRVQGISYPHERVTEDLSRFFRRQGPEFTIGVLHANLGRHVEHENYAPCSTEGLASRNLDYWALGHVHTRAEYALPGGAIAAYPGNPQGRHIRELGERGCLLVEVAEAGANRRFFAVDAIRWHRLEVELSSVTSLEGIEAAVQEQLGAECDPSHDAHVVRVELVGRGPLQPELTRLGALASLEEHLRETLGGREPPVVLESVRDLSRANLDLEAVHSAGGLGAALVTVAKLAKSDRKAVDGLWSDTELHRLELAIRRAGLPSLQDCGPGLVDRALACALDLLQEDRLED
jgi:DNA repair exonuclease SbcCD nuclease subunit